MEGKRGDEWRRQWAPSFAGGQKVALTFTYTCRLGTNLAGQKGHLKERKRTPCFPGEDTPPEVSAFCVAMLLCSNAFPPPPPISPPNPLQPPFLCSTSSCNQHQPSIWLSTIHKHRPLLSLSVHSVYHFRGMLHNTHRNFLVMPVRTPPPQKKRREKNPQTPKCRPSPSTLVILVVHCNTASASPPPPPPTHTHTPPPPRPPPHTPRHQAHCYSRCVEVGVVSWPTGHDLLVKHQMMTAVAPWARRHLHLHRNCRQRCVHAVSTCAVRAHLPGRTESVQVGGGGGTTC